MDHRTSSLRIPRAARSLCFAVLRPRVCCYAALFSRVTSFIFFLHPLPSPPHLSAPCSFRRTCFWFSSRRLVSRRLDRRRDRFRGGSRDRGAGERNRNRMEKGRNDRGTVFPNRLAIFLIDQTARKRAMSYTSSKRRNRSEGQRMRTVSR